VPPFDPQPTLTEVAGVAVFIPGEVEGYTTDQIVLIDGVARDPQPTLVPVGDTLEWQTPDYDVTIAFEQFVVTRPDRTVTTTGIIIADPTPNGFPANLTPSLWEVSEIRASGDGQAQGARRMIFGTLPSTPGFTLRRIATTSSTALTPNSLCESGQTYTQTTGYGIGTVIYNRLLWQRTADGALQLALATSGTTAGAAADNNSPTPRAFQRALTASAADATHGEIVMTIVGYEAGAPAVTAPGVTSTPSISGSTTPGSTLTATPATFSGSPTPTVTHRWYRDGVQNEAETALTYVTAAADVGKAITYASYGSNTGGNALSASSNAITVSQPAGIVYDVSTVAAAKQALEGCTGGETVRLTGTHNTTLSLTNKTYSSPVTFTSQNLSSPATFTTRAWDINNVNNLRIIGINCVGASTSGAHLQDGVATATKGTVAAKISFCDDVYVADCLFDRYYDGLALIGTTDCTIEYNTFRRIGRDNITWFSHATQSHTDLTIRRNLIHETLIYLPRHSEAGEHPDGIQGAMNWTSSGGSHPKNNGVTIEYNWIECVQEGCKMHGIFNGNSASRNPVTPADVTGGGYSLAVSAYQNMTVDNNYIYINHQQAIFLEGVDVGSYTRNWLRRSTSATTAARTPMFWFAPSDSTGLPAKYNNVVVTDNVVPVNPGPGQSIAVATGEVTITGTVVSTGSTPPVGWTTLTKSGASKNVGQRI
jgi:hypothetical protein